MARAQGNVYVDPAYTSQEAIDALGGTSSITGEKLTYGASGGDVTDGANAVNPGTSKKWITLGGQTIYAAEGATMYLSNYNVDNDSFYSDGTYGLYLSGASCNYLYGTKKSAGTYSNGIKITLVNSLVRNTLAPASLRNDIVIEGLVDVNVEGSTINSLTIGGGTTYQQYGTIRGDIKFSVTNTAVTNGDFHIHSGKLNNENNPDSLANVIGTVSNVTVSGSFRGVQTDSGQGNKTVAANYNVVISGSSVGGDINIGYFNNPGDWTGSYKLTVAGSVAANIRGNGNGDAPEVDTFDLILGASDIQTVTGTIDRFKNVTVNAGAKVRANSITVADGGKLSIALGSTVNVASLANISTIYVIGDLSEPDTVLVSGLSDTGISDDLAIVVGDHEYTKGIFPGYYELSGDKLVLHNATSTVLLVNSNYADDQPTELGPKGYVSVASAQAHVTDKATTTIMVYGDDTSVEPTTFDADVVTKDYVTSFSGSDVHNIDLNGKDIVLGDTAADVASANFSATYTNNINAIKVGNVTGAAKLSIDYSGDEDVAGIGTIDLTGAAVGAADISIGNSVIGDVKLADQEGFAGTVTIKSSTIGNVYGGASKATNDLTGGNMIGNVYAEGQGTSIKLAGSTVGNYVAGLSSAAADRDKLVYSDAVVASNLIIADATVEGEGEEAVITGVANKVGAIEASITGGAGKLVVGASNNTIGTVDMTLAGGLFSDVSIGNGANITGAVDVTLKGGTVAQRSNGTFYGLIYGASVTGALDGGTKGTARILNVEGNAKVGSVENFTALNVTGGTLNVSNGTDKSEVSLENTLIINGDILNRRGINAGVISAANLDNYGVLGTYRNLAEPNNVTLLLVGNLNNYDFVMTSAAIIGGNFFNDGRITALGDISVGGTFKNEGDLFFRATSRDGVFTQNGGLILNNANLVNTGFISAGSLTGVKDLTTSQLYVTGGAVIDGNITINADSEVAFTNKAKPELENALTLSGSIYMSDTSNLVVSGNLTTSGTKTITVNVGGLTGANEIVRAEGGVNDWTIKLEGAKAGLYEYVKTETSVTIYSLDELYVNTSFSADKKIVVDGDTLVFGKNAFASVADAVAAAKAGAKIVITGDNTGMDVVAAGFDVEIEDSVVGSVTAKTIYIDDDSTIDTIASASTLTIDADAVLTLTGTMPAETKIVIDAEEGSGSTLVLDVDPTKVTLDASTVTIITPTGKKSYAAKVLTGEAVHAGDLYLVTADRVYFRKDQSAFVDGDTVDAATGDALFAGVNVFATKDEAIAAAQADNGMLVLVGFTTNDGQRGSAVIDTALEFNGGSSGLYGTEGDRFVSDNDHTTVLVGTNVTTSIYGLNKAYTMNGNFTFNATNTNGGALYITGNTYTSVIDGDINASIVGSTFTSVYIGYGDFGTKEEDPIDINLTVEDSYLGRFYGINMSGSTPTKINANINVEVYDSTVGEHFYVIHTADWVANSGANIYQSTFTAGSVTVTMGGSSVTNTLRPGDSLTHGANALQVFNAPTTLHIVATEKSAVTRASWVMEWDTLIIDADARLELSNNLQFTTAYRGENLSTDVLDNAGTPINIYVNMSGYEGGTHTVITAGEIYTDEAMSSISVIGDNDLTGQCEIIVSGFRHVTANNSDRWVVSRIGVFDKTDDMYVNDTYTDDISGQTVGGKELFFGGNAHASFEKPLIYASEWGGTIVVTGGTYEAQNFNGNNVDVKSGVEFGTVTMGDRKASTLTVAAGAVIGSADGSGKSTMNVKGNAILGDVANFADVQVAKGAVVDFGDVSGSGISMFADNVITADSLNFSDAVITIDATNYLGSSHVVISTTDGITGDVGKIQILGNEGGEYSVFKTADGKEIVLKSTIPTNTFLNADYSEATTGTYLADGTYLEFGFNAFNTAADAVANLGNPVDDYTVTVTGGTLADEIHLNGANFAMEGGKVEGYIYGVDKTDASGMSITIDAGSVGGIALTAGEGVYSVTKAAITLGDNVTVDGVIAGADDTVLLLEGSSKVGGIEGVKLLTVSTASFLDSGYIDLSGGTIYLTGAAVATEEGTNLRKVISTTAGISGVTQYACDPGVTVYASGKEVFLMDLTRIYFDPTFTEEITGTTMFNGDVLQWGSNAFSDLNTAMGKVITGGTLYVTNYNEGLVNPSNTSALNLYVVGGTVSRLHPINRNRAPNDTHIYTPVTITIDGSLLPISPDENGQNNNADNSNFNDILGRGNTWERVNTSLSYHAPITITLENGRNDSNLRFFGQWATLQSTLSLTFKNWDIRGDLKPIFGDARAGTRDSGTGIGDPEVHPVLDVTFDNVTFGGGAKWIGLAQVTNWGQFDSISLTIKNSTIMPGTGGNNARIAAFGDGNNDRHSDASPIFFTVENSHVNALLSASGLTNNSVGGGNYATLIIKGSSNFIQWANWFQELDMNVDTFLSGGTITFRDSGIVKVDAKGYTGASKVLVSLSNGFANDAAGIELNLEQDAAKYQLLAGKKGLVIWDNDSVADLYYNPGYTSNDVVVGQIAPTGEAMALTVLDGEEVVVKGNAYGEEEGYDELVGFEAAKAALKAGNALYITGGTFGSSEELDPLYGTIADQDSTAFVNLVVSDGLFAGITIAEEGKTVSGNANLELAGGTFGFQYTDESVEPAVTGFTGGDIVGSKDSVTGGTSGLTISGAVNVRGNVTDFDKLTVTANATISGDLSVTALEIDCNDTLTVNGALDLKSIHLASAEYTGPSKLVLKAEGLADLDMKTITITADGDDKYYYNGKDELWLVSTDPGNVYLCSSFTEDVYGLSYNGDLLVYGVNAFKTMEEAIAHTTSDYTLYVLDGNFSGTYDLTSIGQVNLQIDGGSFGGFVIGDGADADHRSTVRITASTSAVTIGSLAGVAGSTVGYRVIANDVAGSKATSIATMDGIQYFRFRAGNNVNVSTGISYIEKGGELVVNMDGYKGGAGNLLAPANGIANFIQPVSGQTFSRTQVGAQNNADRLMPYYDETKKALVAVERGEFAFLDANATADRNGEVVSIDGKTATIVYGYNMSEWNVNAARYAVTGGTLFADGGTAGAFYYFFTAAPINVNVTGITTGGFVAGYNDDSTEKFRDGDFTAVITASTLTWFAAIAGQGNDSAHQEMVVGNWNAQTESYDDTAWNITISKGTHDTNDFRIARYANLSGGTVNVTVADYDLRGDLMLFDRVFNGKAEGQEDVQLKEVNVTLSNVNAPAAKWIQVWEPQEANNTYLTLTVTDSTFTGDTMAIGLFGSDTTGSWSGEADVYISGVTMADGNLNGGRGQTDGGLNNISGVRRLHVTGGTSQIRRVREFNSIEIAEGALLTGSTISMSEGEGFILRGTKDSDVATFAVVGTTINAPAEGVEIAAKYVDAAGEEIEGFKAVVGSTSVFVYRPGLDVFYGNDYGEATTGVSVVEEDGTNNYLVFGDNAVDTMKKAYAAVDDGRVNAKIQVMSASGSLYTFGYTTVVNGGEISNVVGGTNASVTMVNVGTDEAPEWVEQFNPAPDVASVDITINKGATVTNVIVAGGTFSKVTGDAAVTIADGVSIGGTVNGGEEDVTGISTLYFDGNATVKNVTGFDNVVLDANSLVNLTSFNGAAITIDASNFAEFTKKVLVVEGGFGDVKPAVSVIGAGFGYEFLDDGKTLLVTSDLVGNAYANADWTEADVHDKFIGDMALVWNKNAFSSVASAAAAVGKGSTLYIEGGTSAEAVTLTKGNDVIVSANTSGTAIGALAGDGGTLTVNTDFSVASISGFSALTAKAGTLTVAGGIEQAAGTTITIDMTGYVQAASDAVVLSTGTGIANFTDDDIVLTGEGSGAFHAYYSHIDNSIHAMRVDNFYVDIAFGTAGEGIVEGQTNSITGETLLWGVNAFYSLTEAVNKMSNGMGLYVNGRPGYDVSTQGKIANLYLTDSTVPVLINGYTNDDMIYFGDVEVNIENSTFITGATSYFLGTVTGTYDQGDGPWNHPNRIIGSATFNVTGSTMGSASGNQTLIGYNLTYIEGTELAPSLVTFNFTDSTIYDDIVFIGDSPVGKTDVVEIAGETVTFLGADVVINLNNVETPADKWWRIQDGDQSSQGTITVNIKDSTFGDGRNTMRLALDNNWGTGWDTHAPNSNSDFIFNLEDVDFKGYLLAGRLDYNSTRDAELTSFTGKKVLNVSGDVNVNYTYWFREMNLASDAYFTGTTLRMATTEAKINIDVTGYTGASKVFIDMATTVTKTVDPDSGEETVTVTGGFENITEAGISVIGLEEGSPYSLVFGYETAGETPVLNAVVLKGAVKDIYVNSDYTAETVKVGASYDGEALFYGENAFGSATEAIPALTADDAVLYVTGGKVTTSALKSNSISIDATAQLNYNGSDVITINGSLVNDGKFMISAAPFVDGTTTDILVLTATAIFGDGSFITDDSAYTINVVGNEVHLNMKKLDVFVNALWEGEEAGSVVEVPGGTAIIGSDAFATADAAAAAVSANGSITILASDVQFSNPIVRTVTATADSTVEGSEGNGLAIGTGTAVGSLTLQSGAVAVNANVRGKGVLTVESGAKVTGGLGMLTGAAVSFAEGSILDFDISAQSAGASASVTNYSILTGAPTITITIAADQADGTYALATEAASFSSNAVLQTSAGKIGDLVFGQKVQIDGIDYTLALDDNNVLSLTKEVFVAPITVTYANSEWTGAKAGDVVATGATFGYNAFLTGDEAYDTVVDYGEVKVLGGTASFTKDIAKTLTVNAEATIAGNAVFTTNVTINGTVAFDTQYAANGAQFGGFQYVTGDTKYTLTAAAVAGTWTLASDATGFASDIAFGNTTLKLGEAAIIGDFSYTVSLVDTNGDLILTVAAYVPPTPETPEVTYANSEWSNKQAGDTVTVGTKTATIGYDAFATLAGAIAGTTDDGKVFVVGGEVSFADGYSKTITVEAPATVVGKATFDTAITINGTVAFDTANATAEAAQFNGFSKVFGTTSYTLSVATAAAGTYLLASDAATFNSDVLFGNYTLKVGAEATVIGDFTYALAITDNSDLALTIAEKPVPPTPTYIAKSDVNANGISDVMFQYTGGQGQIGFWLDGTSTWQSTNATHPVDTWEVLGAYDMNANGKADSVLVGNVEVSGIKGAFIGYYLDAMDTDDNWVNISYLTNNEGYVWKNKVGNMTGNEGKNSILWHSTELGALGVWTDGTDNWVSLGAGYDANWEMIGCGDFTGSGKDSVVMSYAGGQVFYTVGIDGAATHLTNSDLGWEVRAIGDFSGDGKDDIVAFHAETGLVAMWGDGSTTNWSLVGQLDAADWFVVGAGDYNGDQTDDLLVRQYSTGMLGYYTNGDMSQWNVLGYGVDMSWTVIA